MKQVAFYWKWWIWKTTIVSNISAWLSLIKNKNILQIGCDPKHDSTRNLLSWKKILPVLNIAKNLGSSFSLDDIKKIWFSWVECIEAWWPEPWVWCAWRWITLVMDILKKFNIFEKDYDYIFYDVLWDVVCWWFAVPIREDYANEVYIIASWEFMSLYAANNIVKAIKNFWVKWKVRLAWIIWNWRNIKNEFNILYKFAEKIWTKLVYFIPRNNIVQEAESNKKTVIEFDRKSSQSQDYLKLCDIIESNSNFVIPNPMSEDDLESFYFSNLILW
jgi:nitrogenase iron protein NifH